MLSLVEVLGLLPEALKRIAEPADRATLEQFHAPDYLDALERVSADGVATADDRQQYNLGTMECPIFPDLWTRATASVGGAILAADLAIDGTIAFHPGGGTHHGRPDRASGFCYLNDPVFAVKRLLDRGLDRVAYVDLDAHHGDGVEAAFAEEPRVHLVSIHEAGRWPGTGSVTDRLGGRALNIPVPRGFSDSELDAVWTAAVAPFLESAAPEGIVVTLGADALEGDPLAGMALSNAALWQATEAAVECAPHAVVLGGGGYNPWTTARLWAGMWAILSGQTVPDTLPPAAIDLLQGLDCDLVDDDDRAAIWFERLADTVTETPVRAEIHDIIATLGIETP